MKRVLIVVMTAVLLFTMFSCDNQEETEKPMDDVSNTENSNSEPNMEDNAPQAYYYTEDVSIFMKDFEENEELRVWLFNRTDSTGSALIEDENIADTLLLPVPQTDEFVFDAMGVFGSFYEFRFVPSKEADRNIFHHIYIRISKDTRSIDSFMEGNHKGLASGEDWFFMSDRVLVLYEDGQYVQVAFNSAIHLESRADFEELITFERYGFNENGLYLIPEE